MSIPTHKPAVMDFFEEIPAPVETAPVVEVVPETPSVSEDAPTVEVETPDVSDQQIPKSRFDKVYAEAKDSQRKLEELQKTVSELQTKNQPTPSRGRRFTAR